MLPKLPLEPVIEKSVAKQGSFHALVSDQIDKLLSACISVKILQVLMSSFHGG